MEEFAENLNNIKPLDVVSLSAGELKEIGYKLSGFKNSNMRKRIAANFYAAKAAEKILTNSGLSVDSYCSLQEIPSIIEKWDIAEVFVNDCRISIRLNFGEYKLFVPKKHERYGIFGDIFMFVRFENNMVKLLGFLPQNDLDRTYCDNENYYIDINDLKSFEDINFNISKPSEDIESLKKDRKKIIEYIDGAITDKIEYFKMLSASKYLRKEMIKFEQAEKICSSMMQKEDSIKKEINNDITNISQLADAFIQSKTEILKVTEQQKIESAENFKLECARANLEKLFNSSPSNAEIMEDIQNKSISEVVDTLLVKSDTALQGRRLPIGAILRAFKVFVFLLLIMLVTAGIFCYTSYTSYDTKYPTPQFIQKIKSYFSETCEMLKKNKVSLYMLLDKL